MNKTFSFLAIILISIVSVQADIIYPDGTKPMPEPYALKKLSRGIANILMAPLELPKAAFDAGEKYGVMDIRQFTEFLSVGPYKTLRRAGSGFYDFATFLDEDKLPKYHVSPEFMSPADAIGGYSTQFDWETIDTPASRTQ